MTETVGVKSNTKPSAMGRLLLVIMSLDVFGARTATTATFLAARQLLQQSHSVKEKLIGVPASEEIVGCWWSSNEKAKNVGSIVVKCTK